MADKILVVDDDREIADLIEVYLNSADMEVVKFYTGRDALKFALNNSFDLAILDIMLPDIDGFYICKKLREDKINHPVLMLTAKGGDTDKISGLTFGADDYMTKPFQPLELLARVKAQLRRCREYDKSDEKSQNKDLLCYEDLKLDCKTHKAELAGKALNLTPTEFEILKILLQKQGQPVSAESIFHSLWDEEYYTKNNNTISVHIRHLREKMQDCSELHDYIQTVWGVGYKIG